LLPLLQRVRRWPLTTGAHALGSRPATFDAFRRLRSSRRTAVHSAASVFAAPPITHRGRAAWLARARGRATTRSKRGIPARVPM
jgi:hypothetical protein